MNVIAIDFDGVLWDADTYTIISKGKIMINKLFENIENFIVIYTARDWSNINYIIDTLKRNKIKFHAITCGKIRASKYIDDRAEKFKR